MAQFPSTYPRRHALVSWHAPNALRAFAALELPPPDVPRAGEDAMLTYGAAARRTVVSSLAQWVALAAPSAPDRLFGDLGSGGASSEARALVLLATELA